MYRDHTKVVQIGNKKIGGGNPILIQSMTNTKTYEFFKGGTGIICVAAGHQPSDPGTGAGWL